MRRDTRSRATAMSQGLLVLLLASGAITARASWQLVNLKELDNTTASAGANSPATYNVYHRNGYLTIVNNCSEVVDNGTIPVPLYVAGQGQVAQKLQHAKGGDGQGLVLQLGGSNWAFSAYPLPEDAGLKCPDCDQWTDVGGSTDCAQPPLKDGATDIAKVWSCTDKGPDCSGRRIGSMWDTNKDATRKRLVAYCNPDFSGRQSVGPDIVRCGLAAPGKGGIIPFSYGTRWETSRGAFDNPDISTNYYQDVCRTDPCRITDPSNTDLYKKTCLLTEFGKQWCAANHCTKTVWDNTTLAQANVFFNIPIAVDTGSADQAKCTTKALTATNHWECLYARCPDAYQYPVHDRQWACTPTADRWFTLTFCPRGSVLVDNNDESPTAPIPPLLGTKQATVATTTPPKKPATGAATGKKPVTGTGAVTNPAMGAQAGKKPVPLASPAVRGKP